MVSLLDHIIDTNNAITDERQREAELLQREPRRKGVGDIGKWPKPIAPTPVKKPRPSTYGSRSTWAECSNGHPRSEYTRTRSDGHIFCVRCMQEAARQPRKPKTHCRKGHDLAGENLLVDGQGGRRCRICRTASDAAAKRR